jgi:uncharacterized protein (DUF433 family)
MRLVPLYTLAEAANYLDMPASTLRYWARPWSGGEPLITTAPAKKGGRLPTLPFIGFAEAFVIKAAIKAGVKPTRVRENIAGLKKHFGKIDHALAHRCVWTDGVEILYREASAERDSDLYRGKDHQRQFRSTVESQLKLIEYGNDDFAQRINLTRWGKVHVLVDPNVAAGAPLLEKSGARVEDLVTRYKAGDSPARLARDYGAKVGEVKKIVSAAAA